MRNFFLFLTIALVSSPASAARSAQALVGPVIEIDAIIPATGGAAFLGKTYQQSFQALENYVNGTGGIKGRPIKFVLSDSQSNPQNDVQIVNSLIAKHVAMFIDGGPSSVCGASLALVEKSGPVDYCLSPVIEPPPGSFVFSGGPVTATYAISTVRFLRERGLTRLAMISSTDAIGLAVQRQTVAALQSAENKGVQLLDNQLFNPTDVSVAAQMAHIKATNPQAIMVWTTGSAFATALRAMKDDGLDIPVLASGSNMNVEQLNSYSAFIPKELYFAAALALAPDPRGRGDVEAAVRQFVTALKAINVRPDSGTLLPWDPALLLVDALRHLGADATSEQIREYIANLHSWPGVMGRYDFVSIPQRGLGDLSLAIARWDQQRSDFVRASRPGGYR